MLTQLKWYQVRIFFPAQSENDTESTHNWSIEVLGNVVKQYLRKYPDTDFWFTKYHCTLEMDGYQSEGLPDNYINKSSKFTRSIRFRFKPKNKRRIKYLENLLKQSDVYWYSGIHSYDHYGDLCDSRFSKPLDTKKERLRRGNLVQKLLEYNSRLILDCVYFNEEYHCFQLEKNINPNNTAFGNISRSLTHLIVNPWINSHSTALPIYGIDWSPIYGI